MDKKNLNKILINGSTSESDLFALANALNLKIKFIGSIYDKFNFSKGSYIFLISPSEKIKNGHWVALKIDKDKTYYFDSYGIPPPQIIATNIKTPLYYNNKQIQELSSTHCGIYCIYFLKEGPSMIKNFKIYNTF
jgi:hypothetical protein